MFDVFPLFATALRPVFVNCLSSRTNKNSSFLYPKYSHTANLDFIFRRGIEIRDNGLCL